MKREKVFLCALILAVMPLLTLPTAASAQAVTNTITVKLPFALNMFSSCANGGLGEDIALSGVAHGLISVTINDNVIRMSQTWEGHGGGIGNISGTRYRVAGVNRYDTVTSFNGQSKQSIADNFRLIGQGPGNNLLMHHTLHITVNSNGDLTVTIDDFWVECK
jgi:hypothetical protein